MSKQHLLAHIIDQLKETESQDLKYLLLEKYKNEKMLERIMSIAYNPWIDLKMQDFDTPKNGKKFGMGISKFLHIIDDIIDNKLDNLIGVLNYPLQDTKQHNTFNSLFDFGE